MDSPAKNTVASARLDLIRGLAASLVVWDHIGKLFFDPVTPDTKHHVGTSFFFWTMEQGYTAVAAFFVLSGFLIGGVVKRSMEKGWDWPRYMIARICRLGVPLLLMFLVCGLIDTFGATTFGTAGIYSGPYSGPPSHGIMAGNTVLDQLNLKTLLGNMCFLETMKVPILGPIANWGSNGPMWSLSCEFWYYIYWPCLAMLAFSKKLNQKIIIGIVLCAALALTGRWILPLFPIWVLGALIAVAAFPIKRISSWAVAGCWTFFVAVLALKWLVRLPEHHIPDYLTSIGFAVALIGTILSPAGDNHRKPNWFIAWSSNISYTLYLVHYPLLMFFSAWLIGDRPTFSLTPTNIGIAVGIMLLAWVFATIMWWIAERNTDKVRGWMERAWHKHMRRPVSGVG